jgi:hypothetical protein
VAFEFGRNGKPAYILGPGDKPTQLGALRAAIAARVVGAGEEAAE